MTTPCEALATKVELEALRNEVATLRQQIINLLGKTEEENAPPIDVLSQGSLAGTLVGGGLVYDLAIATSATGTATQMIVTRLGGVTKVLASATAGISKLAATASAAAAAASTALTANAGLIVDVATIGVAVTNLITIRVQGERIDLLEKELLGWQQSYSDVYSALSRNRGNLEEAQQDIEALEGNLQLSIEANQELRFGLESQGNTISDLQDNLDRSEENNRILKQNVQTLQTDLDNFQEFSTQEIEILKANTETLSRSLQIETENREKVTELAQDLGAQLAEQQGRTDILVDQYQRLGLTQTFQRIELINLRNELNNDVELLDSRVVDLGARVALVEAQVRRQGRSGSGVPANVQTGIANTVNGLGSIATALVGNPATVQSGDDSEPLTVPSNVTWQQILRGDNPWTNVIQAISTQIPDVTNLGGEGVNQADIDAITAGVSGGIDNQIDGALQRALAGAGIAGALSQIQTQTSPDSTRARLEEALCQSAETPQGCLRNKIIDPFRNNFNNIASGLGVALDGVAVGQNASILGKVDTMQNFLNKAWASTPVQATMQGMQTVLLFHNAMMLSRNLGASIGDTASLILNALPLENYLGETIDINRLVSDKANALAVQIFGQETLTEIAKTLNSANRVLTATQGMLQSVHGIKNALQEGQEIIANRIGIGFNEFQEQGILEDNSFNWMPTNNDFKNPFLGFTQRVSDIDNFVSEINNLAQNGIEVQENFNQLAEQSTEFQSASDKLRESFTLFDEERTTEVATQAQESASPEIERFDLVQLEADEI